jgi:hypothetical protein
MFARGVPSTRRRTLDTSPLIVDSPEHPPPKSPSPHEPEPVRPGQPGIRLMYAQARVARKQAVVTAVTPAVPTVVRSGHCHASRLLIFGLIPAAVFSAGSLALPDGTSFSSAKSAYPAWTKRCDQRHSALDTVTHHLKTIRQRSLGLGAGLRRRARPSRLMARAWPADSYEPRG